MMCSNCPADISRVEGVSLNDDWSSGRSSTNQTYFRCAISRQLMRLRAHVARVGDNHIINLKLVVLLGKLLYANLSFVKSLQFLEQSIL